MIFIHEILHIIIYSIICLPFFLYKKYRNYINVGNFFVGLVATFFIDLDHFVDYFLYAGFRFNLHEFVGGNYFGEANRILVLLHSWELVGLIFLCYLLNHKNSRYLWLLFVGIGMSVHIVFDNIWYGFNWESYFSLYRVLHGFKATIF